MKQRKLLGFILRHVDPDTNHTMFFGIRRGATYNYWEHERCDIRATRWRDVLYEMGKENPSYTFLVRVYAKRKVR